MRRRSVLKIAGGVLAGTAAGCVTPGQIFDTYSHEKDAPVGDSGVGPWPTLAHDSRRTSHAPYGWLPKEPAVRRFALAGRTAGTQPLLVDQAAYFSGRRFNDEAGWRGIGPSGLRAMNDEEDWFFSERNPLATPTVAGEALFLTAAGTTRAIDRRDGSLCWEYREGTGTPLTAPTVVGDSVYISGDRLYALDGTTGAVQWATNRLSGRVAGTAATADGVFATAGTAEQGAVYRFEPETGRREWTAPTDSAVLVPPVVGDLVYAVTAAGRLRALEPSDGSEVWSREFSVRGELLPALADGTVYITGVESIFLWAFDALTGFRRWKFPYVGRSVASPTVADDVVYVPTASSGEEGRLYALEAATGRLHSEPIDLPQRPVSPLVSAPGTALIAAGSSWSARVWALTHPAL
jgi:outer membrane protein assembly factor BamB